MPSQHEFSNRLHTLVGLVELGRYDEAIAFVTEVSTARNGLAEYLLETARRPYGRRPPAGQDLRGARTRCRVARQLRTSASRAG